MLSLQYEGGKKERHFCQQQSQSNFGNIMRNVLTEQVDVLTDSTGLMLEKCY